VEVAAELIAVQYMMEIQEDLEVVVPEDLQVAQVLPVKGMLAALVVLGIHIILQLGVAAQVA
jgi:hypothetical protein